MSLKDKVILITGASSGIGAATARALNDAGARLALAARRIEKLTRLASELNNAIAIETDLNDPDQAKTMVDQTVRYYGRIDILINNAASIIVVPAASVTSDDLERAFRINLISPVTATLQAISYMNKQGGGHIINIGSPGFMMGIPYYSPYVCSKAAFSAWTRSIQAEWAGSDILVSEYFPGYIKTDSLPESRIGKIEQDFLMDTDQNFLTRIFAGPKTPVMVAEQLVKLAMHPKTIAYSGFGVRLGTFISNIAAFRLSISRQMAITAATRLTSFSQTNLK